LNSAEDTEDLLLRLRDIQSSGQDLLLRGGGLVDLPSPLPQSDVHGLLVDAGLLTHSPSEVDGLEASAMAGTEIPQPG